MSLYVDLIKKVHPDHNPNFPNAHIITCEINAHKDDEKKLTEIGIKYGLIPRPHNYTQPKPEPEKVFIVENGVVIHVYHQFRNKFHNVFGIVVDIRNISKGKLVGAREVTIVTHSRKVMKFKTCECRITPVRKATPDEITISNKIAIKEVAIPIKPSYEDFKNVGLVQNFRYGKFYRVGARYNGRVYKVDKTTKTYVYLTGIFGGARTIKVYPQSLDGMTFDL